MLTSFRPVAHPDPRSVFSVQHKLDHVVDVQCELRLHFLHCLVRGQIIAASEARHTLLPAASIARSSARRWFGVSSWWNDFGRLTPSKTPIGVGTRERQTVARES